MNRFSAFLFGLCTASALFAAPPEITNVRASQRTGTKLVDISYDIADADGDKLRVRVEISDNDGKVYSVPAFTFTGDIGEGITPGTGKQIVWDAGADWDGEYSDQMRVKLYAIDAQGFPGMEWGNEVPPGGFLLGQDGGAEGAGPSAHVNIPWSYWMAKYEVTRGQYCDFLNQAFVDGIIYRDATSANVYVSTKAPVEYACPIDAWVCPLGDDYLIRWNVNNFEVVGGLENYPMSVTWYGAMLFCRYYGYDLPTEAEWEKAARGPDHDDEDEHLCYPWGNEISSAYAAISTSSPYFKPVGYYDGNQTPMGPDTINGYGLYDVIGNMAEWTRSCSSTIESYPTQESLLDYRHNPYLVSTRILKGDRSGMLCGRISAYQKYVKWDSSSSTTRTAIGFRPVRRQEGVDLKATLAVAENFDTWTLKTKDGETTQTTVYGTWKLSSYLHVQDVGVNGSRAVKSTSPYPYFSLYFPSLTDQLCFIRFKAKNTYETESRTVYLKDNLGNGTSVNLPANMQEFKEYTLMASPGADHYYLYCGNYSYTGVIIDDLELWTEPRESK